MHKFTARLLASVLPFASTLLLAGCNGTDVVGAGDRHDVRLYVTGAAAAALDLDGRFTLAAPIAPTERGIIPPERALALASSYVLSFGPVFRPSWEKERGRSIDLSSLKPDGRAFYASTPYGAFPDGFHPGFSTAFGPYYIVRMMSAGRPAVLVAVAAYATAVRIDAEGKIDRPVQSGSEFVSQGVPLDSMRPSLSSFASPEEAVVRAGRLTGARISTVPELVRVGFPLGPFSSLWRVTLDRPVTVTAAQSGRTMEVQELFLGSEPGRRLMVPTGSQPTALAIDALRIGPDGEEMGIEKVRVSIRPGHAVVFEEVNLQR
ncbi:MAG: hypothetical protein AVDCRST_MAG68-1887 [uncultured Gemmatimonadetes bacterium]|uniref:Uncharacterized protein n=1 Tax=uncultured Gemmatimonadota bacterium TaxID=203437 RepID=A0A6J4L1I3_9BACT|nr:MAG: hypothetical protein AVDCRST_MAG68-1887 [uncultured Gemmatimonadota bacterium]